MGRPSVRDGGYNRSNRRSVDVQFALRIHEWAKDDPLNPTHGVTVERNDEKDEA
jgi:hypothetical protein